MSDRRRELILEEDARWADLMAALDGVPHQRLLEPGITGPWSGKDILAHLGCWMAQCAHVLERIRLRTWQRTEVDVDAMNRLFYEACKDLDPWP